MPNRIERVASKARVGAKVLKATVENLSGVFKQLSREHGEVTALIVRVQRASAVAVRRELFPEIREELLAHENGELAEVYPVFFRHVELAGYAEMHRREAAAFERKLEQLGAMSCDDPLWDPSFDELANLVERHVKEEEDEFFPIASRILGRDATQAMESRYAAARNASMKGSRP
jgi:hemerythrin HHE cation binding domain-containing protein